MLAAGPGTNSASAGLRRISEEHGLRTHGPARDISTTIALPCFLSFVNMSKFKKESFKSQTIESGMAYNRIACSTHHQPGQARD